MAQQAFNTCCGWKPCSKGGDTLNSTKRRNYEFSKLLRNKQVTKQDTGECHQKTYATILPTTAAYV